ncbi:MAG: hypothetical protein AYK18_14945 [Theionarchaea archaeon DG-70]|nr:MAG: hypothetical protein AYK18_14945 [Theionarchaea archaeon DG-70]
MKSNSMTLTDENLLIRYIYSISGECKSAEPPEFEQEKQKCGACIAETFLELPCTIYSDDTGKTVTIRPSECTEKITQRFKDVKTLGNACRSCIQRKFEEFRQDCVKITGGTPFIRKTIKFSYKLRCHSIDFSYPVYQRHQKDINLFVDRMETEAKGLDLSTREARLKFTEYIEKEKKMLLLFFKDTEV